MSQRESVIEQYDFTLKFALGHSEADPEMYLEKLASQGCDDALIGLGQHGRVALDFTREAPSAHTAILGALSDIKRVIPGAKLVEVSPDLVGLTEIADLLGFSRQNMRMLMVRSGSDFPLPVHEGKPAIWHLSTVLQWFKGKKAHHIDEALLDIAHVSMQCNLSKELFDLDPHLSKDIRTLVIRAIPRILGREFGIRFTGAHQYSVGAVGAHLTLQKA